MLDRNRTALLVMDLQNELIPMLGDKAQPLLAATAAMIAAARAATVPVIYVVVGFRPGYPEVGSHPTFSAAAKSGRFVNTNASNIAPEVAPRDTEVIVVKHRVSAFHGTDLDLILRAQERNTLVLCGIATSGVVLSTTRYATDADYKVLIARDACGDQDDEVHRVLLDKVFVRHTTVTTSVEIIAQL